MPILLSTNRTVLDVEDARRIRDERRLAVHLTLGIESETIGISVTHHGEDNCH